MLEIDKSSSIDSYIALQQVVLKCAEPTGRAALAKPMHPAVCPLSVLRGPLRLKRNVDGRDFSLKAVPNEQPSFDVWVETLQVRPPQPIPPARPPASHSNARARCVHAGCVPLRHRHHRRLLLLLLLQAVLQAADEEFDAKFDLALEAHATHPDHFTDGVKFDPSSSSLLPTCPRGPSAPRCPITVARSSFVPVTF